MPTYDFACANAHPTFEVRCKIADRKTARPCPTCGGDAMLVITEAPRTFAVIIPDYPGSKRLKAGYIHSHGDISATKVSSGPGGMLKPREYTNPIAKNVTPEKFHFRKFQ